MFCFSKFCRICFSKNNTLLNVNHLASDNVSYLNKLQFISPTLVEKPFNYMLLWICDKCQAQLNSVYKFLKYCLTSESFLEGYYLQLTSTNAQQNVCNNLKEESIENPIKNEECLEDLFEIQDEQYFSESSVTIVKHELPPVDLKTEIKFNDSTFESIYLEEVEFSFIANDETNKNESDFTECSPNLTKNIPTSCTDYSNDVLDNSNERSVNSSKLLATNRSIQNEKRQNFTNLNRNKSAVNKGKRIECNICKKKLSKGSSMKRHERTHTGERPYKCNVCHKKFNQFNQLKIHERLHSGERPYECNICSKKFNESSNLKVHERLHSGEFPYKCKMCSKKFNQSAQLKVHEIIHGAELPFKCTMCPKKFNFISNLKKHETLHSGERRYKCNICSRKFNQSCNLKVHERLHSGELPYKCNMCPMKFNHPSQLKKHVSTHLGTPLSIQHVS